jgi:thiosulfate/3-mercaptopyruvate sulfurtransferase
MAGKVTLAPPDLRQVVDREFVLRALDEPDTVLVDAREAPRFAGLAEPIDPVAGRIPGARNLPWQQVTSEQGLAQPAAALRAMWAQADAGDDPVVYCGSGVTASVLLLARALAGLPGGRLYAGSWSEWCAWPDAPIARDPPPSAS